MPGRAPRRARGRPRSPGRPPRPRAPARPTTLDRTPRRPAERSALRAGPGHRRAGRRAPAAGAPARVGLLGEAVLASHTPPSPNAAWASAGAPLPLRDPRGAPEQIPRVGEAAAGEHRLGVLDGQLGGRCRRARRSWISEARASSAAAASNPLVATAERRRLAQRDDRPRVLRSTRLPPRERGGRGARRPRAPSPRERRRARMSARRSARGSIGPPLPGRHRGGRARGHRPA